MKLDSSVFFEMLIDAKNRQDRSVPQSTIHLHLAEVTWTSSLLEFLQFLMEQQKVKDGKGFSCPVFSDGDCALFKSKQILNSWLTGHPTNAVLLSLVNWMDRLLYNLFL